jgi:hypothetical protein
VAVGLTLAEPVAEVDVKVPGVMEMLVAPVVVQFRVLLAPEVMPVGLAANDVIAGADPLLLLLLPEDELDDPQFVNPAQMITTTIMRTAHRSRSSPSQRFLCQSRGFVEGSNTMMRSSVYGLVRAG